MVGKLLNKLFLISFILLMVVTILQYYLFDNTIAKRFIAIVSTCLIYFYLTSLIFNLQYLYDKIGASLFLFFLYTFIIDFINGNIEIPMLALYISTYLLFSNVCIAKIFCNNIHKFFAVISLIFILCRIQSDSQIHAIYYVIVLIPFVFLNNKKTLYLVVTTILVLLSLKRTAFFGCVLGYFSAMIIDFRVNRNRIRQFSVFVVSILALFMVLDTNNGMSQRVKGLSDDGGSGREELYENVIAQIGMSNRNQIIWGHGGMNSVKTDDMYNELAAHNDFLEIIYDYGVAGISIYILFVLGIISLAIKIKKLSNKYYISMMISLVLFVVISMFSMFVFHMYYSCILFAFWGMMNALYKNRYSPTYD